MSSVASTFSNNTERDTRERERERERTQRKTKHESLQKWKIHGYRSPFAHIHRKEKHTQPTNNITLPLSQNIHLPSTVKPPKRTHTSTHTSHSQAPASQRKDAHVREYNFLFELGIYHCVLHLRTRLTSPEPNKQMIRYTKRVALVLDYAPQQLCAFSLP